MRGPSAVTVTVTVTVTEATELSEPAPGREGTRAQWSKCGEATASGRIRAPLNSLSTSGAQYQFEIDSPRCREGGGTLPAVEPTGSKLGERLLRTHGRLRKPRRRQRGNMRGRMHCRAPSFVALLALVVGCQDPTQVRVHLRTDVVYTPERLLSFTAAAPSAMNVAEPDAVVDHAWGPTGDIGSMVVVPEEDRHGALGVRVIMGVSKPPTECSVEQPDGCIIAYRRLRFLEHRTVELPVGLHAACEGVACGENETCNALGECVLAEIDPTLCTEPDDPDCMPDRDRLPTEVPDAGVGGTGGGNGGTGGAGGTGGTGGSVSCLLYVNDAVTAGDVFTSAPGSDSNTGSAAAPFATPTYAVGQASEGDVICVDTGAYSGNITIDRSLTLAGVRHGVSGCGRTGDESIIKGQVRVTASASDVTLDGLQLERYPGDWSGSNVAFLSPTFRLLNSRVIASAADGGYANSGFVATSATNQTFSSIGIEGNELIGIYNPEGCNGIFLWNATVTGTTNLAGNCFNNTGGLAILAYGFYDVLNVDANVVVNSGGADSANGIGIGTGSVQTLYVTRNTIVNAGGSGLTIDVGPIQAGGITGNIIHSSGVSGTGYASLELTNKNALAAGFVIADNDLSSPAGTNLAINDLMAAPLAAECNWYGETDPAQVAGLVSGNVDYVPFLTNGTDSDPATPGFQPESGACTGGL